MPATDHLAESTAPRPYVGRFAPSPSGRLHLGSLVCALASYLEARVQRGEWLVRMEDIDPPREEPGAQAAILRTLESHGLHWDREVLRQSSRHQAYRELLSELQHEQLCYRCSCNRRRLQALAGPYDGHCRQYPPGPNTAAAMRLKVADLPPDIHNASCISFEDGIHGPCTEDLRSTCGDFVIHRKDGLFAYQLAVVADDIFQGVTHVVRGSDLLDTTARQIYLFRLLGKRAPKYSHIPVLVDQQQQKLSKQNRAPAIDDSTAGKNLWTACRCLGLVPPTALLSAPPPALLEWALEHWSLQSIPRTHSLLAPEPS